ncbi:MAG: EcoKI restriction-modification system protein HsdS [Candidatus Syntrophoarchaeum sp. GoM_oil]|nr:MAG: EcoKI restriction-modification system protein HsdS [Candidatus Syntrophoarchaeum sp. GoM_oil]
MGREWQLVKLGEVLEHRKGFITIDDLTTYKRCTAKLHAKGIVLRDEIEGSRLKTKKQQVCRTGDFLVAEIDAKVGGFGIIPPELERAIVSSHYFLFEIDEEMLKRNYLDYFIKTHDFQKQISARGSTNYAAIRPKHVLDLEIPLPPLDEQKRIVKRVGSLMTRIEEARRMRAVAIKEMARLLGKSIEKYCFKKAYPIVDFGDLIEDAKNGIYKPTIFLGRGVPCIRMFNIHNGKINLSDCVLLDVTKEELNKYECNPGDIIFNRVNSRELVGKAGLVHTGSPKCVFESKNIRLRVDLKRTIPKYANYIINSYNSKDYFSDVLKQQCGQATLNRTHLDKMPFPLPLIETQQSIVTYLDSLQSKMDELKKLQVETEKEIEELISSILDRAFKGEL